MAALSTGNYLILSTLASQLGLKPVWSPSSGDARSDVDDWLAYALADGVRSAQSATVRDQVKTAIGSNVTPDAKRLFEYYRALLDAPPVPALFLSGQSNAGYQDGVPGTADSRVSLTWGSMYSTVIDGPGPMRSQTPFTGSGAGHSFEWQCGSDLAVRFNSKIMTGKFWADGSIVQYFLPAFAIYWPKLLATINAFALQCAAVGMSQIEFAWCQGESNCQSSLPAELATYEADTSALFDLVKAAFVARGLTVSRITIIKTNANIPLTGGVTQPFLDAVRAAQEHLAVVRSDTSIISLDDITAPGTLHYGNGQTNTGGSRLATSILSRYRL